MDENQKNHLEKSVGTKENRIDFFIEVCFKGSEDIRSILKIEEDQYSFIHHRAASRPMKYYLYGAMNEVEKAGTSLIRTTELLEDPNFEASDRLGKNLIQAVQEEQSLWIRKMTELLTELMLFSSLHNESYYQHYMLVKELKSLNDTRRHAKDSYGCDIQNYQKQVDSMVQEIAALESSSVDISKCWYLGSAKGKGKVSGVKGKLSTLEQRVKQAFGIATPDQIIALGVSFGEGYSQSSADMHFDAIAHRPRNLSIKDLETNIVGIGVLAGNIIVQARLLLKDKRKKGFACMLSGLFKDSKQAKESLEHRTKPSIAKGDFVVASGDLAEVIKVMKGRYGFRSFRVRFLLKEDTEVAGSGKAKTVWTHKNPDFEEFPAMWVKKLYSRKQILEGIKREILKHDPKEKIITRKITPLIRESVIHLWSNTGLKESVHGKKEQAIKKMQGELKRLRNKRRYPVVE